MSDLFIHESNNRGYISDGQYVHKIKDGHVIQSVKIESKSHSFPQDNRCSGEVRDSDLVFVELSFDPLGRIKRGKFYKKTQEGQPQRAVDGEKVMRTQPSDPFYNVFRGFKFNAYQPTAEFDVRDAVVFLLNPRFKSKWKFLAVDPIIGCEEVCVLQEINGVGAIPNLNPQVIPSAYFTEIDREYRALLSDMHGKPESVIDHCRDVVTSILSAVLDIKKEDRKDLGALIKLMVENKKVVVGCAEVINRLHPRRKPNEHEKHGLIELSGQDADFAVQCTFMIIKELRWGI